MQADPETNAGKMWCRYHSLYGAALQRGKPIVQLTYTAAACQLKVTTSVTLTFDLKINGFPGLVVEHLCVKSGDPSCIGLEISSEKSDRQWDKQRLIPTQTTADVAGSVLSRPRVGHTYHGRTFFTRFFVFITWTKKGVADSIHHVTRCI